MARDDVRLSCPIKTVEVWISSLDKFVISKEGADEFVKASKYSP